VSSLSYAIITPARNERDNLQRVADSIIGQHQRPAWWIIVDDGSDDGMDGVANELGRRHDWIVVTRTGESRADLAKGRRRGRDLLAFRRGLSVLPAPVDVFVKVDADTSFDPDYFTRLLEHFETQPDLGIAGGSCHELVDGNWERMKVAGSHPRGASRAYRWALLHEVFSLEPELGWDGVDEVMAQLRGYRTAGFLDVGFRHHRKVGEREGRLKAGTAVGRQAWYMGYRPSYLILRALYRARENAASLAMVFGYAWAAVSGAPQCPNPTVTDRVRADQRLRIVMRRGGWS
jgi:glycosyltransferase involved in cell wall biosynthesis